MITISGIDQLRGHVRRWRSNGDGVAFVPTMGNLHAGHLALIKQAQRLCQKVIVSIFVNPLQFGPSEDFENYPRTLQDDAMILADEQIDVLFTPDLQFLKNQNSGQHTEVVIPELANKYCGEFRPQFFAGVTTIVAKLFNIVQPDVAVFGEKDFQQLICIRRMVQDLCFQIKIHSVPTIRETSGLALSSRNQYLSASEKSQAATLYQVLKLAKIKVLDGDESFATIEEDAVQALLDKGLKPDYFNICAADSLKKAEETTRSFVILTAAQLGAARLIDNITFEKK